MDSSVVADADAEAGKGGTGVYDAELAKENERLRAELKRAEQER